MKRNITLIGMPGSGKSTVGRILAPLLGYRLVDGDQLIEQEQRRSLQDILDDQGDSRFSEMEEQVLRQIDGEELVIAPGGSAVLVAGAMEHLKRISVVCYIRVSLEALQRRIDNSAARGIVGYTGAGLEAVFRSREPLYRRYADITVNGDGTTPDELARTIARTTGLVPGKAR